MSSLAVGSFAQERFEHLLDHGLRTGRIVRQWRGILIYCRVFPENRFRCQLLAWREMRDHPLTAKLDGTTVPPEEKGSTLLFRPRISGILQIFFRED